MTKSQIRILIVLTPILAVALAVVSVAGAFFESVYARETASMAAQGIGQDLVNLFIVAPLLIISFWLMKKGNRTGTLIYGGTVFYILYSFVIYSLGVHFNRLFLLYCLVLGLSVYSFIIFFYGLKEVRSWFGKGVPARATGIFLIIVAVVFYFVWLRDVLPAIIDNTIPKSVSDYNLLVNPVHVIDMAFALPGLIISGILLMKKHSLGYVFTPLSLVFIILMALALAAMGVIMNVKGINEDLSIVMIFLVISFISTGFLIAFLRKLKR